MAISEDDAKAYVVGTMVTKLVDKRKCVVSDLRDEVMTLAASVIGNSHDAGAIFDDMLAMSIFLILADEVTLSERGALMAGLASKKVIVANLIGEPVGNADFDNEEIERIRNSRKDIPG